MQGYKLRSLLWKCRDVEWSTSETKWNIKVGFICDKILRVLQRILDDNDRIREEFDCLVKPIFNTKRMNHS